MQNYCNTRTKITTLSKNIMYVYTARDTLNVIYTTLAFGGDALQPDLTHIDIHFLSLQDLFADWHKTLSSYVSGSYMAGLWVHCAKLLHQYQIARHTTHIWFLTKKVSLTITDYKVLSIVWSAIYEIIFKKNWYKNYYLPGFLVISILYRNDFDS